MNWSPATIVDAQLAAYNAQDLDLFLSTYAEDVVLADVGGKVTTIGRNALRERYRKLFADFPNNHAEIRNRIVFGNKVIDHEFVTRAEGNSFDAVAIYLVEEGLIKRVDFVR